MSLVWNSLSSKPEKKGLTKIFTLQNSCAVRVKISGKLKLVLGILQIGAFWSFTCVKIVVLLTELL